MKACPGREVVADAVGVDKSVGVEVAKDGEGDEVGGVVLAMPGLPPGVLVVKPMAMK